MNDYFTGSVDACEALAKDAKDFRAKIVRVTGLTEIGFVNNAYCVDKYNNWSKEK